MSQKVVIKVDKIKLSLFRQNTSHASDIKFTQNSVKFYFYGDLTLAYAFSNAPLNFVCRM